MKAARKTAVEKVGWPQVSDFSEEVRAFDEAGKTSPQHFDLINLVSEESTNSEPICVEPN